MKAKHHRIPFVDLATRTEAAELPPYPSIFEKDGKHFGMFHKLHGHYFSKLFNVLMRASEMVVVGVVAREEKRRGRSKRTTCQLFLLEDLPEDLPLDLPLDRQQIC